MNSKEYPLDKLEQAVAVSDSLADVIRWFNKPLYGSIYQHVGRLVKESGLDTSHFSHGKNQRVYASNARKSAQDILTVYPITHHRIKASLLTRALVDLGISYECSQCGVSEWNNEPLVLDVDHIDGNAFDCRAENLRFLCPNCHRQTPTFAKQKIVPVVKTCACGTLIKKQSKQCAVCYANRSSK